MFSKLSAMFINKKRNCLRFVKCYVQSASGIVKDQSVKMSAEQGLFSAGGQDKAYSNGLKENAKKELSDRYSVILTSRLLNNAYLSIRYIIVCRPYYCILH